VGRDQGGDDAADNLFPLAGSGTTLCHGAIQNGQRTYDLRHGVYIEPDEVARGIAAHLTEANRRYIIERKGRYFLDRHYPEAR